MAKKQKGEIAFGKQYGLDLAKVASDHGSASDNGFAEVFTRESRGIEALPVEKRRFRCGYVESHPDGTIVAGLVDAGGELIRRGGRSGDFEVGQEYEVEV